VLTETDGRIVLSAARSIGDMVVMIACVLLFGLLTAVSVVLGLRGEASFRQSVVSIAFCGSIASLSLTGLLYYRNERRLVMDSSGIHRFHGHRVHRSLPWNEITEIRHGLRSRVFMPLWSRDFHFFQVRTRRLWRRIYFDGYGYRVADDEVAGFAARVMQAAAKRGIRVLREHVLGGYMP